MRFLLLLLAAATLSACSSIMPVPNAGGPRVLSADSANNPDVLWVVREVDVARVTSTTTYGHSTVFGLFACYRMPVYQAGPPQCYMANWSFKIEDLGWPGGLYIGTDGVLRPMR